ncbi:hypothetical protein FD51_GL001922 [Lacticaseibacillus zeae DSM 20178 = KCTC 3804]|uniref:Gram-positive cocci surface proteins LPxTG domain-containing protein n=2 Tax=Lacticaseibacillus zeae TaxID=57037 RepID=A0A0R1ET20_LACZE|nr:LPXTG cell wall anchor domain-containing protein [Lacticaseibacillus zeae]KRK10103.1 hypothetical protein FD51_GL001922 [Lacticaseibacillus zeae DSM 20178 = KCTC 3804]
MIFHLTTIKGLSQIGDNLRNPVVVIHDININNDALITADTIKSMITSITDIYGHSLDPTSLKYALVSAFTKAQNQTASDSIPANTIEFILTKLADQSGYKVEIAFGTRFVNGHDSGSGAVTYATAQLLFNGKTSQHELPGTGGGESGEKPSDHVTEPGDTTNQPRPGEHKVGNPSNSDKNRVDTNAHSGNKTINGNARNGNARRQLPQTGDEQATSLSIWGLLLAGFSLLLGGLKKRKRPDD